jgi:hypothetical protein
MITAHWYCEAAINIYSTRFFPIMLLLIFIFRYCFMCIVNYCLPFFSISFKYKITTGQIKPNLAWMVPGNSRHKQFRFIQIKYICPGEWLLWGPTRGEVSKSSQEPAIEMLHFFLLCDIIIICRFRFEQMKVVGQRREVKNWTLRKLKKKLNFLRTSSWNTGINGMKSSFWYTGLHAHK